MFNNLFPTDAPKMPSVLELQSKKRTPKFMGWDKVLHPSRPVITVGETPQPTWTSRLRGRSCQLSWMIPVKSPICLPKASSPAEPSPLARALMLVRPSTPPCGFAGVMACLKMLEVIEVDQELPIMSMGLVMTPGISSISSSCVVKDDATGLTYVDTVTTSIGRIILSGPDPNATPMGPTIEDITNQE